MELTTLQLRSKSALLYKQVEFSGVRRNKLREQMRRLQAKKMAYSGEVTKGSKKRITKAIELLVMRSKKREVYNSVTKKTQIFDLAFITLTIPDNRTDLTTNYAYTNLLKPWLRAVGLLGTEYDYVWKLEYQARGVIHYHITTNKFIDLVDIKRYWNKIIEREGLMNEYISKHGSSQPNSTDVHAVYKVKNFAAYLIKYCTKKTKKEREAESDSDSSNKVNRGKIFGCSESLKVANYPTIPLTYEVEERLHHVINKRLARAVYKEYCTFIYFDKVSSKSILNESAAKDVINQLFYNLQPKPI
jgi:hypothetical protein